MKKFLLFLLIATLVQSAFAQCPTITSTVSKTDANCFNTATGRINSVTPSGGQSPYTYSLKASGPFVASSNFTNLKGGNYHVFIKDANGCVASSKVIVIGQPPLITGSVSKTDVTCFGGADGKLTVTNVVNGSEPYKYAPRSGGPYVSSATLSGLRAGTAYKAYIKDAVGCVGQSAKIDINQPSSTATTSNTYITACSAYNWNGTFYSTAGDYTFKTTSVKGCDSFAILHLTMKPKPSSDTSVKACNSYTWNGTAYTASGDYSFVVPGTNGCDSTANLHLSISTTPTSSDTTVTACDSFTWNGTPHTTSGDYAYHTLGEYGCDSAAIVHLTILNSTTSDTTAVVCGILKWHDVNYTATGNYPFHLPNAVGCDSTITLHLTVNNPSVTTDTTALGCGFFKWYDSIYTTTGIYFHYFDNNGVCSRKRLHLTVKPPVIAHVTKTDLTCYGSADGIISIDNPTSGRPPFKYRVGVVGGFSNFTAPPVVTTHLKAGSYRVYVKDSFGCVGIFTPIVVHQPHIVSATGTPTNVTCNGLANGMITIDNPLGVSPFKYKLGSQSTFTSFTPPYTISGLKAGNYHIYLQDGNGCVGTTGVDSVMQPSPLAVTYDLQNACVGHPNSGALNNIATTNGSSPYTYKIKTTDPYISTTSFTGLKANTAYRIYTQDNAGCTGISDRIVVGEITCAKMAGKGTAPAMVEGEQKLSVYPNPAISNFTLQLDNYKPGKAEIVVTNNSGSIVERKNIELSASQNNILFNMTTKAPGTYFIKVMTANGVQVSKVVMIK